MNKAKQITSLSRILYNYKAKRTELTSLPIRLWIEPTDFCNLKCTMCLNKDVPAQKKGYLNFSLFRKIIDEAKDFVYDIYLHHRGEPLMQAHLIEMIRYAKSAGVKVKMHTNGTLINYENSAALIDSGLDLISFSFDGFSKGPYEKIRVNADFDKTINNIKDFLRIKKEKNSSHPYTLIEEIEFPEFRNLYNEDDRKQFSSEFKELGLDEIIFKKLYNWGGALDVSGIDAVSRDYSRCTFLWYAMVVLWDGTVTPCPQDYYGKLRLGNLVENNIREIWNDKPYQELRYKIMNDVASLDPCSKCDRLFRKQVAGLPFQYMFSFLNDNLIGYGRLRKLLGSYERNE